MLRSFQVAQLVYDLTVRFCDRYVDRFSRTKDQMVQAARSGVQNIAEGSEAAATSRKSEIRLTQVARASLEELKLDYEDFLRQRSLPLWGRNHPLRQALIDARPGTADEVAAWIVQTSRQNSSRNNALHPAPVSPCSTASSLSSQSSPSASSTPSSPSSLYPEYSANAIHALATVAGFLLDRQIRSMAERFESEGGFTERLYRVRTARRNRR